MLDSFKNLKPMYCGGPSCDLLSLARTGLRSMRALPDWLHFHGRHVVPLHRARIGVAIACELWGIGTEDDVLVPSYNCGSEIDPIICTGATVRFYSVGSDLRVRLEEIRKRCTERTRVVYITHYFGWPHDLSEIAEFCRTRGIRLFEDCALALFSTFESQEWVGQSGDAAIFSLPKTLGVPDGGILTLTAPRVGDREMPSPRRSVVFRRAISLVKSDLCYRSDFVTALTSWNSKRTIKIGAELPTSYYYEPSTASDGMSRITRNLIADVSPKQIVAQRRRNYIRLAAMIDGIPSVHVMRGVSLPKGVCPVGLPVLVDDRDQWLTELWARRISAVPWWAGFHRGLDWSAFPEARRLKEHLMILPVHQNLTAVHIDYIARTLAKLAGSHHTVETAVQYA